MYIKPISLAIANDFVKIHHRHNKPTLTHKFSIGLLDNFDELIGVIICGRPVSRHLDNGVTLEVNRSCTLGHKNANSMLYGAGVRAGKAMGYKRFITYTQQDESGASLRAANWKVDAMLKPRKNWHESSVKRKAGRDPSEPNGVPRIRWSQSIE